MLPYGKTKPREIEDDTIKHVVIEILNDLRNHAKTKYATITLHAILHSEDLDHITDNRHVQQHMQRGQNLVLQTGIHCSPTPLTRSLSNLTLKLSLGLLRPDLSQEEQTNKIDEAIEAIQAIETANQMPARSASASASMTR